MLTDRQHRHPMPHVINVSERYGGILDFDNPQERLGCSRPVTHVGTSGIISCIGVYIPLEGNKCFVAHIYSNTINGDPISKDQGEELSDFISDRLHKKGASCWKLSTNPNHHPLVMHDHASLARYGKVHKSSMPGRYFALAVSKFFGIDPTPADAKGFVVDHKSGGALSICSSQMLMTWKAKGWKLVGINQSNVSRSGCVKIGQLYYKSKASGTTSSTMAKICDQQLMEIFVY